MRFSLIVPALIVSWSFASARADGAAHKGIGKLSDLLNITIPRPTGNPPWHLERAPRLQRLRACNAEKTFACEAPPKIQRALGVITGVTYGWNVGKGHPSSNTNPPAYTSLLNGLDQCAWFHDRGAWRWNARTKVCEGTFHCANTVGLFRCVSAYQPETQAEQEAKDAIMRSAARAGEVCVRGLYEDYGVEFVRDRNGSQWLSPNAVRQLGDAFVKCTPGMAIPGFPKLLQYLIDNAGK